ncbi:hypothetical protein [Streptomyces chartreusis]|uniref:hypothetical protein n=1 Tax=Streptomyces chartreusis TaxID=1969 RepID=UPI00365C41D4
MAVISGQRRPIWKEPAPGSASYWDRVLGASMSSAADSSSARASAAGVASSAAGLLCARRPPFARPDSPEPTSNGGSEVSRMAVLEAWPAGGTRARRPAGAPAREPGEIRFGARCDAVWTRIWQTRVGDGVEITDPEAEAVSRAESIRAFVLVEGEASTGRRR